MIVVSVMYPSGPDAAFDEGYYMKSHIPLVKSLWSAMGMTNVQIIRAIGTPDGSAPAYQVIALLSFGSMQEFEAAAAAHGAAIFADIRQFTNVRAVVQFNKPLDSSPAAVRQQGYPWGG